MKKVFLYLYPIEELTNTFFLGNAYYDSINATRPFEVLNDTIQKRYRDKGFEIVYAIYPDKNIYGIIPKANDKIIYTNITFEEASGYDKDDNVKPYSEIKYPSEQLLIDQIGNIDELVVGGYHAQDCVKKVAEFAANIGISTLIDLDMTEFFFSLYRQEEYFNIYEYRTENYKNFIIEKNARYGKNLAEDLFKQKYESSVYGFYPNEIKKR